MRFISLLFFLISTLTFGQKGQVKSGQFYDAGTKVFGYNAGVSSVVPENWEGLVPRDQEVFLLSSKNSFAEVYVFVNENDNLESIKEKWNTGLDLGSNIIIKSDGNYAVREGIMGSGAILTGTHANRKGFAEATCGPYGVCIVSLLFSDIQNYDRNKQDLQQFMDAIEFFEPNSKKPYEDFNWVDFLKDKQLVNYTYMTGASKKNELRLCPDGTFETYIKQKGFLKEKNRKYLGTNKGTWTIIGSGPSAKLILSFSKLGNLEAILEMQEERVSINGERYFISNNVNCK